MLLLRTFPTALLCGLLAVLLASPVLADHNQTLERRDLGSSVAIATKFRFMGNLLHNGKIICSALIIGKSWLLVQGFCVTQSQQVAPSGYTLKPASQLTVILGTSQDETRQQLPVSRIVLHSEFNYSSRVNNLAMVQLASSLTYNTTVGSVKIDTRALAALTPVTGLAYPQPGTYSGVLTLNAVQAITAPAAVYNDVTKSGVPLDTNAVIVVEKDTGGNDFDFATSSGIFTNLDSGSSALLSLPMTILQPVGGQSEDITYIHYRLAPAVAWISKATGITAESLIYQA
ncbi:hypothetical protein IWQ60_005245 [Tieghemiomyces parasiticus]|uniref:Peptidase S1 domain-containing protein n=1 Tax=Tieghemiomyces parasiticus TaxID=78921 RepID=A0A9W8DYE5_9FUNG|nr:hypothetical protein IWQ60_005245 [Tieghemiomyces parasiticus]